MKLARSHRERLVELGQLGAGIAHEINVALSGAGALAQLAQKCLTDGPVPDVTTACEYLELISQSTHEHGQFIRQVLGYSRVDAPPPELLDVNAFLTEAARFLRLWIAHDLRIRLELSAEPYRAVIDRTRMLQALLNVAKNAYEAMGGGGTLTLEVSEVTGAVMRTMNPLHPTDRAAPDATGRFVRVVARDTGGGMDPATVQRMFEPFFTTKSVGQGTGMGLATTLDAVRASAGYVSIASHEGQGTAVAMYFPLVGS